MRTLHKATCPAALILQDTEHALGSFVLYLLGCSCEPEVAASIHPAQPTRVGGKEET